MPVASPIITRPLTNSGALICRPIEISLFFFFFLPVADQQLRERRSGYPVDGAVTDGVIYWRGSRLGKTDTGGICWQRPINKNKPNGQAQPIASEPESGRRVSAAASTRTREQLPTRQQIPCPFSRRRPSADNIQRVPSEGRGEKKNKNEWRLSNISGALQRKMRLFGVF